MDFPFPQWELDDHKIFSYIKDACALLAEYSWIYEAKNTDIFIYNVLEKIPEEWKEPLLALPLKDLHQVPYGFIKDDWPLPLKNFIKQCIIMSEMRFPKNGIKNKNTITSQTRKKLMEINSITPLISNICSTYKCDIVIDFGSGISALGQILHHNIGVKYVGLDSSPLFTQTARLNISKDPCKNVIKYETILVNDTEECFKSLNALLKNICDINVNCYCNKNWQVNKEQSPKAIMIGLHCCGKLFTDMMKLFSKLLQIKVFLCIGCCYHLIHESDFPLSNKFRSIISANKTHYPTWQPCTTGFRLAAQFTRCNWALHTAQTHEFQEQNFAYRAILENYFIKKNIVWKKPHRRIRKTSLVSFEIFCSNMLKNTMWSDQEKEDRIKDLIELYHQKQPLFPSIRILIILQLLLQPLWEAFIILDRIVYFKENSIETQAMSLWDDKISPRNTAIFGIKK